MEIVTLDITTDASGDATVNATRTVVGRLVAVEWAQGDLAATTDATLTIQSTPSGVAQTLLTLTNVTTSAMYYPRVLVHDAVGAALTGTSGGDREPPFIYGAPRVVVAQGGDTKSGSVRLYIEELHP